MYIIGTQGPGRYLVDIEEERDGLGLGRVLDLDQGLLFPPWPIGSIVARGYWQEYAGSQDVLPGLLRQVEEVEYPKSNGEKPDADGR